MLDLDEPVTGPELAELLGVRPRQIVQFAQDGLIERTGRGRFRLGSIAAYIANLREQAAGRASVGPLDLGQERARLAEAQRARIEIELEEKRGRLVDAGALGDAHAVLFRALSESLRGRAGAFGLKAAGETEPGRLAALYDEEVCEALEQLATLGDRFAAEVAALAGDA